VSRSKSDEPEPYSRYPPDREGDGGRKTRGLRQVLTTTLSNHSIRASWPRIANLIGLRKKLQEKTSWHVVLGPSNVTILEDERFSKSSRDDRESSCGSSSIPKCSRRPCAWSLQLNRVAGPDRMQTHERCGPTTTRCYVASARRNVTEVALVGFTTCRTSRAFRERSDAAIGNREWLLGPR
jgi:hypothetical protein